jgi:light-independent protochlorophyllide reductase subunit B
MGWEGANTIFDSWVHPLMMGLEEHLIGMFRHDFEFVDGHRSHLGDGAPASPGVEAEREATSRASDTATAISSGPATTSTSGFAGAAPATATLEAPAAAPSAPATTGEPVWTADGEAELQKIPFFVRGKVRRNTETFARVRGIAAIDSETLYDAKAHFSR